MKKRIIKFMIITYVIIMVVVPLLFYLSDYEKKPVRLNIAIDLANNNVSLLGSPYAMKKVLLNDKELLVIEEQEKSYTDGIRFDSNKSHHIVIHNGEGLSTDLYFAILPKGFKKKTKIKVFSKLDLYFPQIAINGEKQFVSAENALDLVYNFKGEKEIFIDIVYRRKPFSLKYGKYFTGGTLSIKSFFKTIYKNVSRSMIFVGKRLFYIFKFVFKYIYITFKFVFKWLSWFWSKVSYVLNNISQVVKNTISYFRNFRYHRLAAKTLVIPIQDLKEFYAGHFLNKASFKIVNGLQEPLPEKKIIMSVKPRKSTAQIVTKKVVYTDKAGKIYFDLKCGDLVGDVDLVFNVEGKKITFKLNIVAGEPVSLKNLSDSVLISYNAGKLVKNAFKLKVLDEHGNPVANSTIDFFEREPGYKEEIIFASTKSDSQGIVRMDYRMADEARRFFMVAKTKNRKAELPYTVQVKATRPENMEPVGEEDKQAIIGVNMDDPFQVKYTDKYGNPIADLLVEFIMTDENFEELGEKSVRTDKAGIATAKFKTPKNVGVYQITASNEKMPEYEAVFSLTVLPGAVTKVEIVSGNNQILVWGEESPIPLRIRVLDGEGNPVSDASVNWRGPRSIDWVEVDHETANDGIARALFQVKKTRKTELFLFAKVGKTKVAFKVIPRAPSVYKLYLKSKAKVKVFAGQYLTDDMVFVLQDQYHTILPFQKVEFEYAVIKRGVTYLQNTKGMTNAQGIVSLNFLVSDQKDSIDFKAIYYQDEKPNITWVKIDVLPENISYLTIEPMISTTVVGEKLEKSIAVFVGDNNRRPVSDIYLDLVPERAPPGELDKLEAIRLKTNRKGLVNFKPVVGNTSGAYIYTVNLNKLSKMLTVNAEASEVETIKIMDTGPNVFPVASKVSNFKFRAFDKYKNLLKDGEFYYNVVEKKKVVKHDFNQVAKINKYGEGIVSFNVPEKAGNYVLFISDKNYHKKIFYPFKAKGENVNSIVLLEAEPIVKIGVGTEQKKFLPFQVIDKYGNPTKKIKMSLDLYKEGSTISAAGVDTFASNSGKGEFKIKLPEEKGFYRARIYPTNQKNIEYTITLNLISEGIKMVQIVSGDNQFVKANTQFNKDFVLRAIDEYGNNVKGAEIQWKYNHSVNGEERKLSKTRYTNNDGISTFNYVVDNVPGVREIRAYYKKGRKWEFISFYVKLVSNIVDSIKLIAGNNQEVVAGEELPDYLVVKIADANGFAISNLPVIFDIRYRVGRGTRKLSPLTIYTDEQGISKAKFQVPLQTGKYIVWAYPRPPYSQFKVKFEFKVVPSEADQLIVDKKIDKASIVLKPVDKSELIIPVNYKEQIAKVLLSDDAGTPVPGRNISWSIYDKKLNQTYKNASKTDSDGFSSLPKIDVSYPRELKLRATDTGSDSSVVFNLSIVSAKEVQQKLAQLIPTVLSSRDVDPLESVLIASDNKELKTAIIKDYGKEKSLNPRIDIQISQFKVEKAREEKIVLYTNRAGLNFSIANLSSKVQKVELKLEARKANTQIELAPGEKRELVYTPANISNIELLQVFIKEKGLFKRKVNLINCDLITLDSSHFKFINYSKEMAKIKPDSDASFIFVISCPDNVREVMAKVDIYALSNGIKRIKSDIITIPAGNKYKLQEYFSAPGKYSIQVITPFRSDVQEYFVEVK